MPLSGAELVWHQESMQSAFNCSSPEPQQEAQTLLGHENVRGLGEAARSVGKATG